MNILFICNQGQNRNRTAAELFADRFETELAGLYCQRPVSKKQFVWADVIIVMEKRHKKEIAKRFPRVYVHKRILSLAIPDVYRYGQPELIEALKVKINGVTLKK